jgi:hypothetical protein
MVASLILFDQGFALRTLLCIRLNPKNILRIALFLEQPFFYLAAGHRNMILVAALNTK